MKIKINFLIIFIVFVTSDLFSQNQSGLDTDRKGIFYVYWGWNRGWYTNSDIHFEGMKYDFVLSNVVAKDRPTPFSLNNYFGPFSVSIPQVNFRVGLFIKNNYSLSLGFDHMKYVVDQNQIVKISGLIHDTESAYDGTYSNDDITIQKDFLKFEHTNGLNYINMDARRFDKVIDLNKIKINLTEGIGAGILLPRTNTTLFGSYHNDTYHLSGYGISGVAGINVTIFKIFFIQSEFKAGYINMPNIQISQIKTEKASQHFFFTQGNLVFGVNFSLKNKKSELRK